MTPSRSLATRPRSAAASRPSLGAAAALVTGLLGAPAHGRQASDPFPYDPAHVLPWSGALPLSPDGDFKRAYGADLDGDGARDVVLLAQRTLVSLFGPHAFHSIVEDPSSKPIHDLAVLPGVCHHGGDAVLTSGPAGLRIHTVSATTAAFLPPTTLAGSHWADVITLRVAPGDGRWHVFGLSQADERTIYSKTYDAATGFAEASIPLFVADAPVLDFTALHFDSDLGPDLAVLSETGLTVVDPANPSTPLVTWVDTNTRGCLTSFRDPATTGQDALAWVTPALGGDELRVVRDGSAVEPSVQLVFPLEGYGTPQPIVTRSLAAGDADGDGAEELFLVDYLRHRVVVLENRCDGNGCPATTFSSAVGEHAFLFTSDTPELSAAANLATASVDDLDADGRPEFLYPATATAEVLLSQLAPDSDEPPHVSDPPDAADVVVGATYQFGSPPGGSHASQHDLLVQLEVPPLSFEPTHVQVVYWEQDDPIATPSNPVDADASGNFLFELHGGTEPDEQEVYLSLPASPPDYCFGRDHLYIEFRFVTLVPSTWDVDDASRSYIAGFTGCVTATPPDVDASYLQGLPGYLGTTLDLVLPPSIEPSGTWTIGAMTPQIRTPHYPENQPPVRGAVQDELPANEWTF